MRIDIKPNKNNIKIGDIVNDISGNMYLLGIEADDGYLTLVNLADGICEVTPFCKDEINILLKDEGLLLTARGEDIRISDSRNIRGNYDDIA
ncbi:hypothetical protein [Peptostreptococcus faecalis]|uniref:hypothetical protein n=1 Tax=Peptostreptococcus faecalis TaxID=2045015 RepID=UPI000C7E25B2|nr:hypothetical protein [Peptostreptococcus faecalis]